LYMSELHQQVMLLRLRPYANFLQLNCALALLCTMSLLALLVLVFPVIHDTANRRRGIWSYFNQIKIQSLRLRKSISK